MPDPIPHTAVGSTVGESKREIRTAMRTLRRDLIDREERSRRVVDRLLELEQVRSAAHLMTYTALVGEVDTGVLVVWAGEHGVQVAVPEDGVDPEWPDVVIVPGTAFTRHGDRIGQGGGWYDRFLVGCRSDATTIGVGFSPQVCASLPTEPHDVVLDYVVTDESTHRGVDDEG